MSQKATQPSRDNAYEDQYSMRGSNIATEHMSRRLLAENGAFMLPFLQPGMRLLDCGCGPGTMTIEIAELVAPSEVIGIDIGDEQITRARQLAVEQGIPNVHFEKANIYNLPFSNHTFDAVFSHALLEHLQDPLAALREMYRMLKPGGMVMVRTPDWDGNLIWPSDPLLEHFEEIGKALFASGGGNPFIGKQLRGLLHRTGFEGMRTSASYTSYETDAKIKEWQQVVVTGILSNSSPIAERIVKQKIADPATLAQVASAWHKWAEHPEAFHARAWCEAVAWVPIPSSKL
jgi:ubiquinone/menaquinone biosynthesis C-methylase UbiE